MSAPSSALLLTGAVGSGKTTLATEIGELLHQVNMAHAIIELDWLAWCMTPSGDSQARRQLVLENLACTVSNYEAAGIRRFVLAGSIVSDEHLNAIKSTLDETALAVVFITAPAEVLLRRVQSRDAGRQTLGSINQAEALIATTRDAVPGCLEVDNSSEDVTATAESIVHHIGWPTGSPIRSSPLDEKRSFLGIANPVTPPVTRARQPAASSWRCRAAVGTPSSPDAAEPPSESS